MRLNIYLAFISFLLVNFAFAANWEGPHQCELAARDGLSTDSRNAVTGFRGFSEGQFQEGLILNVALVLETEALAYYFSSPCDICAELHVCDKKTGKLSHYKSAHNLDCLDLPSVDDRTILYSDCL